MGWEIENGLVGQGVFSLLIQRHFIWSLKGVTHNIITQTHFFFLNKIQLIQRYYSIKDINTNNVFVYYSIKYQKRGWITN